MTNNQLEALEREVEGARRRVTDDLARLRAPETIAEFKRDLLGRVQETKDDLVRKANDAVSSRAQRLITDVKARVAANPVATVAIGAGLAWRLVRHPPIASLLVGAGMASLLRTDASQNGSAHPVSRASEFAETISDKMHAWQADAREATEQRLSQLANSASSLANQAKDLARDAISEDQRDKYLLGFAALAVGAATVISYQRRAVISDQRRADSSID
jgi:ElaB/YqjD/DUF883 family membrane-anchored ribosome-binding protein